MTRNRPLLRLSDSASRLVPNRVIVATVLAVAGWMATVPPVEARVGSFRGVPVTGDRGVETSVASIMSIEAGAARPVGPSLVPDHEGPPRGGLPQNPQSPATSSVPAFASGAVRKGGAFGLQVESPQTIGTNFTGAALFDPNHPTNSFPPDCMGAVGPTQYVVAVNGRIATFNKSTGVADGVLNASTNSFFSSVRNGSVTSDPRIRYDRLSGRWFVIIINVSTPDRILIAVSDAASAGVISNSTVFTYYFINVATTPPTIPTTCFADYPTFGVDANALYIGTNDFCGSPGQTFTQTDGYVVRKTSVLSGGPIVVTVFRGLAPSTNAAGPYTPQGVDNYDPASTEGYFIGNDNASHGTLMLRRVSSPGGTPSISDNIPITVPSTAEPLTVPHLGNSGGPQGQLDALDDRLFAAHLRNGRLWTAHNLGVDNTGVAPGSATTRDGARWYELAVPVGSGTPTVVQSGTVFASSGTNFGDQRYYWIPSVMVSGQGHAALGFSTAGTGEYANAGTVGRLATDPLGTMQSPVSTTASGAAYNPPGDDGSGRGARRWGDYSYTSLDPIDDMTMWTVQMFTDATNSYGVRVTKLIAPPPATPTSLGDVTPGQSAVGVDLFGTSSGSGYYDPGANLPGVPAFHHLTVVASTGGASGTPPTVTSATYVNPTQIHLVLNTTSATVNQPGQKYTVTVTNPDGQAIAAAVLHVVASVPSVSIGAGPSQNEGASGLTAFNFPVTLSSSTPSAVTVFYSVTDGTATAADGDFQGGASSITIPANQTSGTITVNVVGDTKHESNETFGVTITSAASATVGAPSSASATILNDDAVPTLSFTTPSTTLPEGDSGTTPFTFNVGLSNPTDQVVTVNYHTVDQTATVADGDYQAATSTLNIPAGATTGAITVNGLGDTRFEPDESFKLVLSGPTNATLVAPTYVVATLQNDDIPPYCSLADTAVVEGNSGTTTMMFRIYLSSPAGDPVDVTYETNDLTATTANNDYIAASGTVTIPSHGTSAYIPVQIVGDTEKESNETFAVSITDLTNAVANDDQAIGTILDDDVAPLITIGDVSVTEGNAGTTAAVFPVTLTNATDQAVTVDWQTGDSTATVADQDYVPGSGTLTIPAKTTVDSIAVMVNGDTAPEPDETFTVRLSNPANAGIARAEAVAAILNDDGQVGVADARVTAFALSPVVPNPTAVPIQLEYALPRAARVTLTVHDLQGREVARVVDGDRAAGRYRARWNTNGDRGPVGPGVYFVRLNAGDVRLERRFAIVR